MKRFNPECSLIVFSTKGRAKIMPVHTKFERCEDLADPRRCQSTSNTHGQCPFKAMDGTKYCPRHGGIQATKRIGAEHQRLLQIAQWSERFGRQADHPKLKTSREEVAVLRMTLEAKLLSCKDDQSLLMNAGAITNLVREIAKTVEVCHRMEVATNVMLDKTQAEAWVQEIGQIISNYIEDPAILEMIAEDMMNALQRQVETPRELHK